ncbi:MAG: UDP-N-acetylglucosamine 2-epimerase (non-hydrolyzing) [Solirubrobacteraceae bacterium]
MQTVVSVIGTRPNFMKMAPVIRLLADQQDDFRQVVVHTGQHYDRAMSDVFLEQLGVGAPDHMLGVGSGSHATQTARVMERLEPLLVELAPDIVLVPGDVNSTLAAALTAAKLDIAVGHVEAGLRSFDRTMPEELNRVITDQLSSVLFTHSPEANGHLLREGCRESDIHLVGNTMIDTLVAMKERIEALDTAGAHGLRRGDYLVVTLHRPALVDGPLLRVALEQLDVVAQTVPVIFPIHPRTRASMAAGGICAPHVLLAEPLGYLEFLSLVASARGVLTDSGGIQEETTYLGIPCFTLRDNTERPITCSVGTNTLLGLDPRRIAQIPELLERPEPAWQVPPLWDGHAAQRLVAVLRERSVTRPAAPG